MPIGMCMCVADRRRGTPEWDQWVDANATIHDSFVLMARNESCTEWAAIEFVRDGRNVRILRGGELEERAVIATTTPADPRWLVDLERVAHSCRYCPAKAFGDTE